MTCLHRLLSYTAIHLYRQCQDVDMVPPRLHVTCLVRAATMQANAIMYMLFDTGSKFSKQCSLVMCIS